MTLSLLTFAQKTSRSDITNTVAINNVRANFEFPWHCIPSQRQAGKQDGTD